MKQMRIHIVTGHYGSGKTNFSLCLAKKMAKQGETVTIVDLDIVNPYFRSSDYTEQLRELGIRVIAPSYAGTTLDVPALSPEIGSVFAMNTPVIFDVGGDDAGATALGRYAKQIDSQGYEMLYVINKNRNLIADPADAVQVLREIEHRSRLKAHGLVNNTHMSDFTTARDILFSLDYANEVSRLSGLPVQYTAVKNELVPQLKNKIPNLFGLDIIVKPIWK
ncbi:MAG: hypothetical protein BGN88_12035 [Clostridiales bacterium 43-6]|nr:MAG: hypothetical protein BGN88_12035 [Clostridiales bacterium 43-6]